MQTDSYYNGMPRRWSKVLAARFDKDGMDAHTFDLVHRMQNDIDPLPWNADESAIHRAAEQAQRECYAYADRYKLASLIIDAVYALCERMGVNRPVGKTEREIIARSVDKRWWLRQLRKEHGRRFEHMAIQLGCTGYHCGAPYLSDESVISQLMRNRQNAELLRRLEVMNQQTGQRYTLEELAALGVANKTIRRGELMTRIRGFEEIATDMKHVAMFWTITAPSKYHAVLRETGEPNPKHIAFGSPTPRDAQAYLQGVWKCIRSAFHRRGIQPYGLRIAEPHHDGCPHWHMLLFVAPEHAATMEAIVRKYALEEDGDEAGAQKNRVKLVRIEASKGTAAGYCVKYICKNVDGKGVGEHKTLNGYTVVTDMLGDEEIKPSQRVTYWAQKHGIRQFQQIGGAPVGVWRELRRIKEETMRSCPPELWAAWLAVQKIEGGPEIAKQASWAHYLKAQGGPTVGRKGIVQLAKKMTTVHGRYATYDAKKPCGVYHIANQNAVYESVRYQWVSVEPEEAVAVPWTGVNNCTQRQADKLFTTFSHAREHAEILKNKKICSADWSNGWNWEETTARPAQEDTDLFLRHRKNAVETGRKSHLDALKEKHWFKRQ